MDQQFFKYEGAGNDFVLLDDRRNTLHETFNRASIARVCDRHFGVGADGLMFLRSHPAYDFEMIYYNSDGATSSMCGNGGRCIVRFAADLGLIEGSCNFLAVDGPHEAHLLEGGRVSLGMSPVTTWKRLPAGQLVLDTGSPHYVTTSEDPKTVDVIEVGRAIRSSPPYQKQGINVNFIAREADKSIIISTYERGVEDETLACGTGVTAAAIYAAEEDGVPTGAEWHYIVRAKGGRLAVRGKRGPDGYEDLWLEGPANFVFRGYYRR